VESLAGDARRDNRIKTKTPPSLFADGDVLYSKDTFQQLDVIFPDLFTNRQAFQLIPEFD
jgi:hypothetical protein